MKRGTPPPIKDGGTTGTAPTGRSPRSPRAPQAVISSSTNKAEVVEKPVETKPRPNPMGGGVGDLMAEIAKGKQLKSVNLEREPELPPQPKGGLVGALSAALEANRKVVGGALDDAADDDSDWD